MVLPDSLLQLVAVAIGVAIGVFIAYSLLPDKKEELDTKSGSGKRKIIELFEVKNQISNNDVEKYLDVSDATATRLLDELEKRGTVKQIGKTGRHVYYERVSKK